VPQPPYWQDGAYVAFAPRLNTLFTAQSVARGSGGAVMVDDGSKTVCRPIRPPKASAPPAASDQATAGHKARRRCRFMDGGCCG
jgi:hypothetical protein